MKQENKTVYSIATAHLDTSWLWTYEQTATEFLPDTCKRNFALMEKFPSYKFNFEGSLRYELLREYHPQLYAKLKEKISCGRWHPCGACYENGDVNIVSPEALLRNILYGNGFFEEEFGVRSDDIFLPDCFGFGRALPTVAAHCRLQGFSTGKLAWGGAADIPFHIGRWNGIDGKGIWFVTDTGSYTTILKNIRKNKRILEKLQKNTDNYKMPVAFCYHGTGDRGGAPHISSVRAVCRAEKENNTQEIGVVSATTKEFFDAMEERAANGKMRVPQWDGELLMTAHGTGSYTSRTVTKRWNRRCELLADTAERFAVAALVNGMADYPQYILDTAWKKVIAHHFHDDITGTSFEECYRRSYNDYVQAMHSFSAEYTAACRAMVQHTDTSFVKGTAVVVANGVQGTALRREAVCAAVGEEAEFVRVFDRDGCELPSQKNGGEVIFMAQVPSCGYAVFDVRASRSPYSGDTGLSVGETYLENKNLLVRIDERGDLCSVYDKRLSRELLKNPVRAELLNDVHSFRWPSWEISYEDISSKAYACPADPVVRIRENGPARVALEIVRRAGTSTFTQILSLDAESTFVRVDNETDWREEATLLKLRFDLAAENENAAYDIGIGYTHRGVNTKRMYEVPAQRWAALTDDGRGFGVAVLSDSRCGWDHPAKQTLRLTCMHTPMASYRHECAQHLQDMGLNRYSFALCGYTDTPACVHAAAEAFCQPMQTFVTDRHGGELAPFYSFFSLSNDLVRVTALKKAQKSDMVILRVAEGAGMEQKNVQALFAKPLLQAFEVSGDEAVLGEIPVCDGSLSFDIGSFGVRSFALVFGQDTAVSTQQPLALPYNACGITDNQHRAESTLQDGVSLPAELLPDRLLTAGVRYSFAKGHENCVVCSAQKMQLPDGCRCVHLLMGSLTTDTQVCFAVDGVPHRVTVPSCSEAIGTWDLAGSRQTGYIKPLPQALTLSHTHGRKGDFVGRQFYLFTVSLPVDGASVLTLPDNGNAVIFAATAQQQASVFEKASAHFDTLEKRPFNYSFSKYALHHATENKAERLLDRVIRRTLCIRAAMDGMYNKNSVADIYFGVHFAIDGLLDQKRRKAVLDARKNER